MEGTFLEATGDGVLDWPLDSMSGRVLSTDTFLNTRFEVNCTKGSIYDAFSNQGIDMDSNYGSWAAQVPCMCWAACPLGGGCRE